MKKKGREQALVISDVIEILYFPNMIFPNGQWEGKGGRDGEESI